MTSDQRTQQRYSVLAVASSAGGIKGLGTLLSALGTELRVPVLIVQHLDRKHRSYIAEVLARRSLLPVKLAQHREPVEAGTVYVAPPDHHLLVGSDGRLSLTSTDLVHFVRPSADLLFESVAAAYGDQALVCVLTGTGVDGAKGVDTVKAYGGTVIVQDPLTAEFKGMPDAAVATGAADFVLPLEDIAATIRGLVDTKRQ
ncbi:chemotaxis protein CheB [Streptomyces sp. NPDC050738]|uniref:chemotaxis protein CheB n=1 Tax=Streptomyces sp. NPDC050738 TaxID=3154744 RepID=UPI003421179F